MTKILVDKAVLEQALEALRCVDLQSLVPDYGSGHYSVARLDGPQVKSAITVMEAALAEPVQEPVEPVAYIHRQGRHWEVSERPLADDEKARGWTEEPLFTAPPQRKPLTETSAERTLKRLGYTDCGGEFWKPPLGAPAEPVQEPVACEPQYANDDGWCEWVCPKPTGYLMQCCDCGLIHEVDSRVAKYQPRPSEEFEVVDDPDLQVQWRMKRRDDISPKRKPLTEDEIALIVADCSASAHRQDDFHFARAIERAHGIGGQP